jgi:heptosyltransferase II
MKGPLLRLADATLGRIVYFLVFLLKFVLPKNSSNRVLIIKLWAVGDTVTTLPSVKVIKEAYPEKEITALCTKNNVSVYEYSGLIDSIILLNYRNPISALVTILGLLKKGYSLCIDYEPYSYLSSSLSALSRAKERVGFSNRSLLYTKTTTPEKIHVVNNFIKLTKTLIDVEYHKTLVKLKTPKSAKTQANELLPNGTVIGMHVGSGSSSIIRRWKEENFAELADKLIEKYDVKIVITGSDTDKKESEKVISLMKNSVTDLTGKTDLITLAACLEQMDLYIANDSGPMHISAAMGTKTIGLFGPNKPELYGPINGVGIYKGPEEPYIKPFEGKFPEKYRKEYDVNNIPVDDVLEEVSKLL